MLLLLRGKKSGRFKLQMSKDVCYISLMLIWNTIQVSSWFVHKTAEATRHATTLLQEPESDSLLCGNFGCTMKFASEINFNRHTLIHVETNAMACIFLTNGYKSSS